MASKKATAAKHNLTFSDCDGKTYDVTLTHDPYSNSWRMTVMMGTTRLNNYADNSKLRGLSLDAAIDEAVKQLKFWGCFLVG